MADGWKDFVAGTVGGKLFDYLSAIGIGFFFSPICSASFS